MMSIQALAAVLLASFIAAPLAAAERPSRAVNCWSELNALATKISYARMMAKQPVEAAQAQEHYRLARVACSSGNAADSAAAVAAGVALLKTPR